MTRSHFLTDGGAAMPSPVPAAPPAPDAGFWMVTRKPVKGEKWGGPKRRHASREIARAEAQRLAALTGAAFLVLETVEEIAPPVEGDKGRYIHLPKVGEGER